MPITLSYAEQATGIVLGADGSRELDAKMAFSESVRDLPEAIEKIEKYLVHVPDSEAWISYRENSYRVTMPAPGRFEAWFTRYSASGDTGPISIGMDLGAVISEVGFPSQVGHGLGRRGLAAIFRYSPGSVDFHFLEDGTLFLVYDDDLDDPRTILKQNAEQDVHGNTH
jgi:hypothetical protein